VAPSVRLPPLRISGIWYIPGAYRRPTVAMFCTQNGLSTLPSGQLAGLYRPISRLSALSWMLALDSWSSSSLEPAIGRNTRSDACIAASFASCSFDVSSNSADVSYCCLRSLATSSAICWATVANGARSVRTRSWRRGRWRRGRWRRGCHVVCTHFVGL
jgi:hypothetical protein